MNVNQGKDRLSRVCPVRTDHGLMKSVIHVACDTHLMEEVVWSKQDVEKKFDVQKQIELGWEKTSEWRKKTPCPIGWLLDIAQTYWKNSTNKKSIFCGLI